MQCSTHYKRDIFKKGRLGLGYREQQSAEPEECSTQKGTWAQPLKRMRNLPPEEEEGCFKKSRPRIPKEW